MHSVAETKLQLVQSLGTTYHVLSIERFKDHEVSSYFKERTADKSRPPFCFQIRCHFIFRRKKHEESIDHPDGRPDCKQLCMSVSGDEGQYTSDPPGYIPVLNSQEGTDFSTFTLFNGMSALSMVARSPFEFLVVHVDMCMCGFQKWKRP